MSEEEILGQSQPDAPAVAENAKDDPKEKILGKFTDVLELEKAYVSLQAELTRKSQMLAQLQQGNVSVTVESKPVEVAQDKGKVIEEYLLSLAKGQKAPTVITVANEIGFSAKPEPMSLRDIERVAENYFKTKGN